ncbi:hypothetical protein BV378_29075 [Nostoc sp. RF31YmG]|nr:hypothetical protein BV378_29075 [Nostoc sp. RF31YmG]
MSLIEKLTPQQEALIPVYRDKWRKIALSTERIDREKAAEAVKLVYAAMQEEEPEIIFVDSLYSAIKCVNQLDIPSGDTLFDELCDLRQDFQNQHNLFSQFSRELSSKLGREWDELEKEIFSLYMIPDYMGGEPDEWESIPDLIQPIEWIRCFFIAYDFDISVFHFSHNQEIWQALESLFKYCGRVLPYKNICILCDRPLHLRFDNQHRLHAEGEPAIEYADGFSLYSYHGVTLPKKYGKVHPQQWQASWLLTEDNAELRRVLIQGIGYSRICQKLKAIELDTWAEYTLLKIDVEVDEEAIYLLKMTCPSTGFIHALRVPPQMKSAREAISWVNWGIPPEEFAIQT